MNAYIIDTNFQINRNHKKNSIIFTNIENYILSNEKDKLYLYNKNRKLNNLNFFEIFFNDWYRNTKGIDVFENQISYGKILNRCLFFSFLNDIKNYFALKYYSKKFKKIFVKTNNISIRRVSKFFNNIKIYKVNNLNSNFVESTPERKQTFFFKKNYLRESLFYIDRIINSKCKKNKVLILSDWTNKKVFKNNNEILRVNSKIIKKGFYWKFTKKNNKNYFLNLKKINFYNSEKILKDYFIKDYKNLNKCFIKLFHEHYNSEKKIISDTANIISETLKHYQPKGFILFGNYDWLSILISDLCKIHKVKIFTLLDGHLIFKNRMDIPRDRECLNENSDYFFAYGKSFEKILLNHSISKNKIINIKPPYLVKKNYLKKNIYDGCILAYDPYIYNLSCTWDSQIITELSVLEVFEKLKFKNIVIKIKPQTAYVAKTRKKSEQNYKNLYKKYFKKELNLNIHFENGNFIETCKKSKLVVGALSTAMVESIDNNTPYYVYEPFENGMQTYLLKTTKIIKQHKIIKNKKQLEKNIKTKNSVKLADKKDLIIGKDSNQIKFTNYL